MKWGREVCGGVQETSGHNNPNKKSKGLFGATQGQDTETNKRMERTLHKRTIKGQHYHIYT